MDRRQAAQLEWMRRNYALLTPEQRAIVDAADGRAPKDPNRSTAEVAFGDTPPNVESDLDAAATPMPAEPVLQPGRKRSRADWAVDSAVAGQLYTPSEQVAGMRVNDKPSARATSQAASDMGITPPGYDAWAEAMTDAETGTTRAERQALAERTGRRIDAQAAAYNRVTGLESPDAAGEPPAVYAGDERPAGADSRPGIDRTYTPQEIAAQRADREAAMQAQREQWADERNDVIEEKYGKGARGIAEAGDAKGVIDFAATQTQAERARNKERRSREMQAREGDTLAREKLIQQDAAGAEKRKAFRAKVAASSTGPSDQERLNNWRAHMMLSGGRPTRASKAAVNAWLMMNDPNVSEEQRTALRYMLPGGALSAQVDARQLDAAAGIARNAITGALAGAAQGPLAQAQAEMLQLQAQAERDKLRAQDEEVMGDKYAPAGYFGYDEFTIAEQQQMYDELIAQGYRPGDAQRAVDRQAQKRRATERQRWGA